MPPTCLTLVLFGFVLAGLLKASKNQGGGGMDARSRHCSNKASDNSEMLLKTEVEQHRIVSLPTWSSAMYLSNTCNALTVNLY